jgi:hypothetical protein
MDDGNEHGTDKPVGTDGKTGPDSLAAAASHVAASPGTGRPGDGGSEAFTASFRALVEWAETRKLIRFERDFPFFQRPTDGHGDEHEAWFEEIYVQNQCNKSNFSARES